MWILYPPLKIQDIARMFAISEPTARRLTAGLTRSQDVSTDAGLAPYVETMRRWTKESGKRGLDAYFAAVDRSRAYQSEAINRYVRGGSPMPNEAARSGF